MKKKTKKTRTPAPDVNQIAYRIMREATGQGERTQPLSQPDKQSRRTPESAKQK